MLSVQGVICRKLRQTSVMEHLAVEGSGGESQAEAVRQNRCLVDGGQKSENVPS